MLWIVAAVAAAWLLASVVLMALAAAASRGDRLTLEHLARVPTVPAWAPPRDRETL